MRCCYRSMPPSPYSSGLRMPPFFSRPALRGCSRRKFYSDHRQTGEISLTTTMRVPHFCVSPPRIKPDARNRATWGQLAFAPTVTTRMSPKRVSGHKLQTVVCRVCCLWFCFSIDAVAPSTATGCYISPVKTSIALVVGGTKRNRRVWLINTAELQRTEILETIIIGDRRK
jgi:hypothetical protein